MSTCSSTSSSSDDDSLAEVRSRARRRRLLITESKELRRVEDAVKLFSGAVAQGRQEREELEKFRQAPEYQWPPPYQLRPLEVPPAAVPLMNPARPLEIRQDPRAPPPSYSPMTPSPQTHTTPPWMSMSAPDIRPPPPSHEKLLKQARRELVALTRRLRESERHERTMAKQIAKLEEDLAMERSSNRKVLEMLFEALKDNAKTVTKRPQTHTPPPQATVLYPNAAIVNHQPTIDSPRSAPAETQVSNSPSRSASDVTQTTASVSSHLIRATMAASDSDENLAGTPSVPDQQAHRQGRRTEQRPPAPPPSAVVGNRERSDSLSSYIKAGLDDTPQDVQKAVRLRSLERKDAKVKRLQDQLDTVNLAIKKAYDRHMLDYGTLPTEEGELREIAKLVRKRRGLQIEVRKLTVPISRPS